MLLINRSFYFLIMLSVFTQSSFSMEDQSEKQKEMAKKPFIPLPMLPKDMEYIIDENGNRKLTKRIMPAEKMARISEGVDRALADTHRHKETTAQGVPPSASIVTHSSEHSHAIKVES